MRVFLAIEVPATLQQSVAGRLESLRPALPAARYTPPGNVHLTLHFFGERTPERVAEIATSLGPAVSKHASFALEVRTAGAFPASRPRVLWLGLSSSEALVALHGEAVRVLRELGEEIDSRPFHPHLTLARVKAPWRGADLQCLREGLLALEGERLPVSSLTLYESRLHPRGSRYERVRTFDLAGGSSAAGRSEIVPIVRIT